MTYLKSMSLNIPFPNEEEEVAWKSKEKITKREKNVFYVLNMHMSLLRP